MTRPSRHTMNNKSSRLNTFSFSRIKETIPYKIELLQIRKKPHTHKINLVPFYEQTSLACLTNCNYSERKSKEKKNCQRQKTKSFKIIRTFSYFFCSFFFYYYLFASYIDFSGCRNNFKYVLLLFRKVEYKYIYRYIYMKGKLLFFNGLVASCF